MGLFDVFKKKDCEICGKEVGVFGYKKLEDGEICKDCVKLLSPWFEERRHSTVAQIKEQLAYRAQNQRDLANFRVAQVIGDYYKVYIEETNGVPTRFFVSDADDYMSENPDIICFKDLMSCTIDEDTHEKEIKRQDADGNSVSYNPPRYETDYNFYVQMQIANNPYFDNIRFRINRNTVTLETRGATTASFLGLSFTGAPVNVSDPREQQRYQEYTQMCQQIEFIVQKSRQTAPAAQTVSMESILMKIEQIKNAPDLLSAVTLGAEVARQMTALSDPDWERAKALNEAAVAEAKLRFGYQEAGSTSAQEAPKPKFCSACGAPADGGKFCQYCGSPM